MTDQIIQDVPLAKFEKAEFNVNGAWARFVIVGGEVSGLLIKALLDHSFAGHTFKAKRYWMLTECKPVLMSVYPALWSSLGEAERAINDYLAKAPK